MSAQVSPGRRRLRLGILAFVLCGCGFLLVHWYWLRSVDAVVPAGRGYSAEPVTESYFLYDLGVADIDGDRRLDLFTTNHSALQAIHLNTGDGFGANVQSAFGLDHKTGFPGLAARPERTPLLGPGLQFDLWRSAITLESAGDVPLAGEVRFAWPATVATQGAMRAERLHGTGAGLPAATAVRFAATGAGTLLLEAQPPPTDGLPIELTLAPNVPLERVFIGPERVTPTTHTVRLTPRDRHGMAWADLNGDGTSEVFVSLGGLRGQLADDPTVQDQLLERGADGRFVDVIDDTGIAKAGCPGRRAAWVDIDGNGRLDLYQVCGRGGDGVERATAANRLYLQGPDGRFVEAAAERGLAIEAFGTFAFFDVEGDGLPDLLWAGRDRLTLYRNRDGRFTPEDLGPTPPGPGSRLRQISIGDVTRNGMLDVFVASRDGNALLLNEGGTLRPVAPASLGLPPRAHAASWVDTDNSGRLDLASLPGGIFRQAPDGSFSATRELAAQPAYFVNDARAAWFDLDGNGTLDAVIAVRPCFPGRFCAAKEVVLAHLRRLLQQYLGVVPPDLLFPQLRWIVSLHRATPANGHWLAVDVVGTAGNRPSVGARVTVETTAWTMAAEVGQLEAAHQSQGNYRLHFGLGELDRVERLSVRWPDGASVAIDQPAVDRGLDVRHPDLNDD